MKYITLAALFFILVPVCVPAQNFAYKAKLQPVTQTGFYRINVNPGISAFSQAQLSDLRLFDNDGNEIPYLLKKETDGKTETQFVTYPFSTTIEKNRQTIVVENKQKIKVNVFQFDMKNADASRLVRISGSDDKQKWYVVRDSFYFESLTNENQATIRKQLSFPATDYGFYKIELVTGEQESPLNIINAGNYKTVEQQATLQQVTGLSFTRVDSNKTTYLRCTCKPANRIDKLSFSIAAPEMFHRTALIKQDIILTESESGIPSAKRHKRAVVAEYRSFELSSDKENTLRCTDLLGYEKASGFTIEIQNLDDQPLEIRDIKAYQLTTTATAKLEEGKTYFLYFGDSMLLHPAYDIVYFANTVSENARLVEVFPVQPKAQKDKDEYNGAKDKYIVWIGLALVGIIVFLLTLNMMKKMKPA